MGKLLCCMKSKIQVNQLTDEQINNEIVSHSQVLFAQRTCTHSQTTLLPFSSTLTSNKCRHQVRETSVIFNRSAKEINEFIIGETIGQGSFGKVKTIIRKDKEEKFAVKIFKKKVLRRKKEYFKDKNGVVKQRNALDDILGEIAVMKKLDHENVIKLIEVINDEVTDKIYMEKQWNLLKRDNLSNEMKTVQRFIAMQQIIINQFYYKDKAIEGFFSEDKLRQIFRQCVKGLYYLHENGIIHRDFKPQNILFDAQSTLKIGDFGVAVLFEPETKQQIEFTEETSKLALQTDQFKKQLTRKPTMQIEYTPIAGTYFFMSPECQNQKLKESGNKSIRGKPIDIWALGVTMFSFTFLELPFYQNDLEDLFKLIRTSKPIFPKTRTISKAYRKLFLKIFEKDPNKRITLPLIAQDPWINQGYSNLLEEINIENEEKIKIDEDDIRQALGSISNNVFSKQSKNLIKNQEQNIDEEKSIIQNKEEQQEEQNQN